MGCEGCGTKGASPAGCGNNGHCQSGGCSRLEVFDWLADIAAPEGQRYNVHEVSFKNGARKDFFVNDKNQDIVTGDYVVVETGKGGYDIGRVSMSGELVRLQMKKKRAGRRGTGDLKTIIRKARGKELDKLAEARAREKETMLRARVLARNLGLDMKLGDVEYQADLKKATFYYTADTRIDFRQLIKDLAYEFKVRIEMRQIGSRQEAGRVGGIGACGRELCCSTWLTNFQSVNTTAARYQNLAINQTKLSGQCGRLKCCLNYELDTYLDALRDFPDEDKARRILTVKGDAFLVKTDVLKGVMTYQYREGNEYYTLGIDDVKTIVAMNERGEQPEDLSELAISDEEKEVMEFEDVVGQISLQSLEKHGRKGRSRGGRNRNKGGRSGDEAKQAPRGKSSEGVQPRREKRPKPGNRDGQPKGEARPNRGGRKRGGKGRGRGPKGNSGNPGNPGGGES